MYPIYDRFKNLQAFDVSKKIMDSVSGQRLTDIVYMATLTETESRSDVMNHKLSASIDLTATSFDAEAAARLADALRGNFSVINSDDVLFTVSENVKLGAWFYHHWNRDVLVGIGYICTHENPVARLVLQ